MGTQTGKRLAKNTLLMYTRMILLMVIAFFTTRVLLQKLGVTDFGIYNVVGSVVAIFSSLRGLFVTSTQRFLNFELGRGNYQELKNVFNTSIIVNAGISIIFVICVEIVGLWFINNEINIPAERITDVYVILHLSVLTSVVYLMTTPFDALIIAHENITAYAYFTVFDHILKLLIIYMLFLSENKLVLYSGLLLFVSVIMQILYYVYCRLKYKECRLSPNFDKSCFKRMFSFAGWQFLGNTSYTLTHNGINMLLNVFGGPVANAARSIVYQISGALNQLIINLALVLSPYSVKSFASNNHETMFRLFFISSKIMFIISICAIIPLMFLTDIILQMWLGSIPEYTVEFVKLILIWSVLRGLHQPVDTLFKSVGKIKLYQISESMVQGFIVLLSYFALVLGYPLYVVFVLMNLFEFVNLMVILRIARNYCNLNLVEYYSKVLFPCVLSFVIVFFIHHIIQYSNLGIKILAFLLAEMLVLFTMFFLSLTYIEKNQLKKVLSKSI